MAQFGMTKAHREALRVNRLTLVNSLDVSEILVTKLMSKRIMTDIHKENLDAINEKQRSKRAAFICDLLPRRGPNAMKTFIEALMETAQDDIADHLDKRLADEWRHLNPEPGVPTEVDTNPGPVEAPRVIDQCAEGVMNTEVRAVTHHEAQKILQDQANYPMKASKHGRAILLHIEKFDGETDRGRKLSERVGSSYDLNNLRNLFERLNYEVEVWQDLTKAALEEKLFYERKNEVHDKADSFVLFIMSHGLKGGFYSSDCKIISLKYIVNDLGSSSGLKNKPKMIFVQACQGDTKTRGVTAQIDGARGLEDQMSQMRIGDEASQEEIDECSAGQEDFFIAYSTVPGFVSIRVQELGTWFVREVVLVFSAHAHQDDLAELLRKVRLNITQRNTIHGNYKQLTLSRDSCSKRIYFLPGYGR